MEKYILLNIHNNKFKYFIYGISGIISFFMLIFSIHVVSNTTINSEISNQSIIPVREIHSPEDLRSQDIVAPEKMVEITRDNIAAEAVLKDVGRLETFISDEQNYAPIETLFTGIQGAVKNPGYYHIAPEARVQQLIDLAGGLHVNADLSDINLAAWVLDGAVLYIPEQVRQHQDGNAIVLRGSRSATAMNPAQYTRRGWRIYWHPEYQQKFFTEVMGEYNVSQGTTQTQTSTSNGQSSLININTASATELQQLPGIGPVMAGNIIEYRSNVPFRTIQDITQVSGIGEKRFEAIQNLITVGP